MTRSNLLFAFVAALALVCWAAFTGAYATVAVFGLSILAAVMCGYFITEYFFIPEKQKFAQELGRYRNENAMHAEQIDILQKQAALSTPQAEIDTLQTRLIDAEEQKKKLNSEFYAQAGIISNLNARLDRLQDEQKKMTEDTTIIQATFTSEMESLRDKLLAAKENLNETLIENKTLKHELAHWKNVAAEPSNGLSIPPKNGASTLNAMLAQSNPIENNGHEKAEKDNSNDDNDAIFARADEDLTCINGIGPKMETYLKANGIINLETFALLSEEKLRELLSKDGSRFRVNDPSAMIQQAANLVAAQTK